MGDRGNSSAFDSDLALTTAKIVIFAEFNFTAGYTRLNSTPFDIDWNSETWLGFPVVQGMNEIIESSDLIAQQLTFQLSGIPSEQISNAFTGYHGRSVKIWLGFLDENNDVNSSGLIYSGIMEMMTIEESSKTSTITLVCGSILNDLNSTKESLFTHEEQQRLFPGDMGLEFISEIQNDRSVL